MFLENPAQITECLLDNQGVGVLIPKPGGGHSPWLDVGVAVTFGDDQNHPAAESTMVLVLPAVIPCAFRNTKTLQGIDQKAGEARCSLANALGPSFLSHLEQGKSQRVKQEKSYCGKAWKKGLDPRCHVLRPTYGSDTT